MNTKPGRGAGTPRPGVELVLLAFGNSRQASQVGDFSSFQSNCFHRRIPYMDVGLLNDVFTVCSTFATLPDEQ